MSGTDTDPLARRVITVGARQAPGQRACDSKRCRRGEKGERLARQAPRPRWLGAGVGGWIVAEAPVNVNAGMGQGTRAGTTRTAGKLGSLDRLRPRQREAVARRGVRSEEHTSELQ